MTTTPKAAVTTDQLIEAIEQTACMLRGMTMDYLIPEHAKEAMRARIIQLEELAEQALKD